MGALVKREPLLTVRDFMELEYDPDLVRYELQEGNLIVKTSPPPKHGHAAFQLGHQLQPQLPSDHLVLMEIDVNLELAPADKPGTVRKPDLYVVSRREADRACSSGELVRASGVLLAVEVLSPSSMRMDRVIKFAEYADSGIEHYWMIDLEPPISLRAFHLAGPFGYRESEEATGTYSAQEPFPATIDLTALRMAG